jgi:glycosyltransferase involved in cell wall biosynthesis
MRIVHIEDFFHPDAGYQINILAKYQAREDNDVIIVTAAMDKIPERLKGFFGSDEIEARDAEYSKKYNVKIIRKPIYSYYSGRSIYKFGFFRYIISLKPDLLYVHGNDSFAGIYFTLINRMLGFPLIFDNHMLEMATKNYFNKAFRWFYRNFISTIIIKRKLMVIRVVEDDFVLRCLGIPLEQAPVIPLGTDTMQFNPDAKIKSNFRKNHNIPENAFVVLYMGKLTTDKGALLLAEAFQNKFELNREIILIIVGNSSSEYGIQVQEKLKLSENRVILFPTQKYTDLAQFYQMADLSVFPKHCSLSFYDVQSCGLPVILENNNINIDRLRSNNGLIFNSGDAADLRTKLIELATMSKQEYLKMQESAIKYISENNFDYSKIILKYNDIINETIIANKNS